MQLIESPLYLYCGKHQHSLQARFSKIHSCPLLWRRVSRKILFACPSLAGQRSFLVYVSCTKIHITIQRPPVKHVFVLIVFGLYLLVCLSHLHEDLCQVLAFVYPCKAQQEQAHYNSSFINSQHSAQRLSTTSRFSDNWNDMTYLPLELSNLY